MSRLRDCPYCFGTGIGGHAGKCGFCHGKKKVFSDYCVWKNTRDKYDKKIIEEIEEDLEFEKNQRLHEIMDKFDEDNPKPKKFGKK